MQLNYSFDDDNHGDDGFGPVSEHFNDDFSVMNNQTDDVFSDNFAAANTYKYVLYLLLNVLLGYIVKQSSACAYWTTASHEARTFRKVRIFVL